MQIILTVCPAKLVTSDVVHWITSLKNENKKTQRNFLPKFGNLAPSFEPFQGISFNTN